MQNPMRTMRQPMRIKIGDKEGCLEEDEAGNPNGGRTA
jgi:hypothetical protein